MFGVGGAVYVVQRAGRNAHFGWDAATPLPADVRLMPTGTLVRGNVAWAMILSGFWSAVAAYAGGRWLAGAGALVFAWGIKGCWNLSHVLIWQRRHAAILYRRRGVSVWRFWSDRTYRGENWRLPVAESRPARR